jgi:hypothetical protein
VSRICKYESIPRSIDDEEKPPSSATCSGVTALMSDGLRSRFGEVILETIGEIAATSHILSIPSSSVSRQTHVSSQ